MKTIFVRAVRGMASVELDAVLIVSPANKQSANQGRQSGSVAL